MAPPRKDPARLASASVSARLTESERAALEALLQRRADDMEAQSMPGDASFAGWLRAVIREKSKAAGIPIGPEPKAKRRRA